MESDASWTNRLSSALSLREESQDWGICNSDAGRVLEFIEFYEKHTMLHPYEPEALAELIIASFDDALRDGVSDEAQLQAFVAFVRTHSGEFPSQHRYWSSLDPAEFPVSHHLRAIG
jgi:hypothetical protein